MYVTTNSAVVWKRMADENRASAQMVTRIAIALFVMLLGTGAYAYSAHSRISGICQAISHQSNTSNSKALIDLANSVQNGLCT